MKLKELLESRMLILTEILELLAQMAEEAAELAQAALKFRRVLDETNPTSCSFV